MLSVWRDATDELSQPIALTKQADIHLLQRVNAAELIELVVDLVEDQSFVVVRCEVPHYVVYCRAGRQRAQRRRRHTSRVQLSHADSRCDTKNNRELRINTLVGEGYLLME